jgi:hypothetical protein
MTSAISDQNDDEAYFAYDGSGRRVGKSWDPDGGSQVITCYVYDIAGRTVAEYSDETLPSSGTSYIFADLLGSVRLVTNDSGNVDECFDYLPFGRMLTTSENGRSSVACYPSSPSAYTSDLDETFTGQKRDETRTGAFRERRPAWRLA